MLKIAKFDRYDMLNVPMNDKPSFTIWFSGCHHNCKGCQNPELLDGKLGFDCTDSYVIDVIKQYTEELGIRDVVFLGGEPMDQNYDDIYSLAKWLHDNDYRIWLYTGNEFEELPKDLTDLLYTIKCGKYIENLRIEGRFPITFNQRVFRNFAGDWKQIDFIGGNIDAD